MIPDNDTHCQSEKVLGLRNSLHRRVKAAIDKHREETTSSESPARLSGLTPPLVNQKVMKRSGRFSSHEQFSLGSSHN